MRYRVRHGVVMRQVALPRSGLIEHLAQLTRVPGIVLDKKNSDGLFVRHFAILGSFTMASQRTLASRGASWVSLTSPGLSSTRRISIGVAAARIAADI